MGLWVFGLGCNWVSQAPAPPLDTGWDVVLEDLDTATLVSEIVGSGITGAVVVDGHQLLLWQDGVLVLQDAVAGKVDLGTAAHAAGSWTHTDGLLLAVDGDLGVFDGTWLTSIGLDELSDIPVEEVVQGPESTWLWGAGTLHRLDGDQVSRLSVSGRPSLGDFAVGGGELWVATPGVLGFGTDGLELLEDRTDLVVHELVRDAEGTLWAQDGSRLLHGRSPGGDWTRFVLPDRVEVLLATWEAPDMWVRTTTGAFHHRGGQWSEVSVPEGSWEGVDPLGRLVVLSESELIRVSVGRPVDVVGLRPGQLLQVATDVRLLPTAPDALTGLAAWVGDDVLVLEGEQPSVTLDPEDLGLEVDHLRVAAIGPEGVTVTELSFTPGDLPDATWADDVGPLAERACLVCHAGDTATRLETASDWEDLIDAVLDQVGSGGMPLGGPPLTADEVSLVRGWKAGGFP